LERCDRSSSGGDRVRDRFRRRGRGIPSGPRGWAAVHDPALLSELDAATQEHGLAVPAGQVSHTGVGGLTLGGGIGWLMRHHGLTIDSLQAAEVVLADGQKVRASADEHSDLFWALRGGGGDFGVVTMFEFRAHRVGPTVPAGMLVYPWERAGDTLRASRHRDRRHPRRARR
jgi:FAD/FMN-containing dehydrogenase